MSARRAAFSTGSTLDRLAAPPARLRRSCRRAALYLIGALLATSCGSGRTPPSSAGTEPIETGTFPVTIDAANGELTIEEEPTAIVSLSPTATEMLFAIDAGDQVVAVDDQSDFPPEVPTTDLSGFEPNVEAVASYEPDLVVLSNSTPELERSFEKLDIPMLLQPAAADLTDTYEQIEQLGEATGHAGEADDLVAEMRTDIESIVASLPTGATGATYYHELDDTYFSVTSETFIGEVYSQLGLENVADAAKGAGSGYPQLSAEYIIEADPDLVFLADTECCDQSLETVAARPGWDQITAVETGAVVELDDDVASRWGPRIVDLLEVVAAAVTELETSEG